MFLCFILFQHFFFCIDSTKGSGQAGSFLHYIYSISWKQFYFVDTAAIVEHCFTAFSKEAVVTIPLPQYICSSMSTGNDRDRESSCYSDSSLESDQFQCDLALIMIHGNNTVELFLNQRFVEYNVRRERTHCIDALFLSPLNSRFVTSISSRPRLRSRHSAGQSADRILGFSNTATGPEFL